MIDHARGLVIADFGVDWRTPRPALKREAKLKEWLTTMGQAIQANPSTTIRVLGFSDCIGKERNNFLLRRGRGTRVVTLLSQMAASRAQWNAIKAKMKEIAAAPANDYLASNDTIEGRAQNRGVLLEHTRTIDMGPEKVCVVRPSQIATYPLLGKIPNDPDYQKHVPIDYRLNAKDIIGKVAQDVSKNGTRAHFIVDLAHFGILAADIFGLIGALGIAGGALLMVVGNFLVLGIPCIESAEEQAKTWSTTGFARGVIMGANRRSISLLRDYFGNDYFPPNNFCPQARNLAMANYKFGLVVGYVNGRVLCPNQHVIFWRDIGRRMGDQSYRGDPKTWSRAESIDWYVKAAATFQKDHLN